MASDDTNLPVPYPLAIVICDGVHIDPSTKKYTLLGTYASLRGAVFSMVVEQLVVYMALTDVRGVIPFELRIVRISPDDAHELLIFNTHGEFYSAVLWRSRKWHSRSMAFSFQSQASTGFSFSLAGSMWWSDD